jgi:hypothetical protein
MEVDKGEGRYINQLLLLLIFTPMLQGNEKRGIRAHLLSQKKKDIENLCKPRSITAK